MQHETTDQRYTVSPGGPAIVLTEQVITTFDDFRQRSRRDKEAGGQLFAKFAGTDTIIMEATGPTLLDRRHRTGFEPNQWLQRREIRRKRGLGLHFIGDWHTHPESIPRPSYVDLQNMQECFLRSTHELANFVLIIVGTATGSAGLYVALVGPKIVRLKCDVNREALLHS